MTHNQWAEIIRSFLKPCLGYSMDKWPTWADKFIYNFADFLSGRPDLDEKDTHKVLKEQWKKDVETHGLKIARELWEFSPDNKSSWNPIGICGPAWDSRFDYRRKEPPFEPQYFSGLNWRDALPLVGKVVEFSDDPDNNGWRKGTLDDVDNDGGRRFSCDGTHWEYIRTTPETHAHPTVTLTVNGKDWILPMPETEVPEMNSTFWFLNIHKEGVKGVWESSFYMEKLLEGGNVHLTESRAQAWADFWNEAILGPTMWTNE